MRVSDWTSQALGPHYKCFCTSCQSSVFHCLLLLKRWWRYAEFSVRILCCCVIWNFIFGCFLFLYFVRRSLLTLYCMCRDGTAQSVWWNGCRLESRDVIVCLPVAKRCSSPKGPDRLWDPPNLLYTGTGDSSPVVKQLTTRLYFSAQIMN
jgi:hypothetical protein